MNLRFSSDGRNSLCNIVSSSHQILAVRIIAVSSTHSLKSSLPINQTRLLHLVFVPLRCFEILVLSDRTLSLTKSPLLHPGCWQGQSLILSCTVMKSHLAVQNYLKVNFWRSDTAFEITMSSTLMAQKTAVQYPLQRFLRISPKPPDCLRVICYGFGLHACVSKTL